MSANIDSVKQDRYFVGVDVGTGSARAGVFTSAGRRLGMAKRDIQTWKPAPNFVEQSSDDIWRAVCDSVRSAVSESGIDAGEVAGIGFDATCSLVVLDGAGEPLPVTPDGQAAQNVIVWMDHRAVAEAAQINGFGEEEVLRYVGGKISPEMQIPKLLWLKSHHPTTWRAAAHFLDLPDFLTFRATGDLTRSLCSTVCKWTYLGHRTAEQGGGWDESFFARVGLEDLPGVDAARIGSRIRPVGESIGHGLSESAAQSLGLTAGTAVGVSLIDAHAGGVGMVGASIETGDQVDFNRRLALIGGTSSCHMAVSTDARFIPGVWGPYWSAMIPGLWLNEGGQSASGALVDHVIGTHGATGELNDSAARGVVSVYEFLNRRLDALAADGTVDFLTGHLHVNPDFHGNRSPRANPDLRGMICGLRLSSTLDDLALLYLATVQAIACGTRHIVEEFNRNGYEIDTIFVCGGGTKNPVFLRQHANVTGCRLILPEEPEAVLVGAAILGAVAAGDFPSVEAAMREMTRSGSVVDPDSATKDFHDRKLAVFHRLHADQVAYEGLMR